MNETQIFGFIVAPIIAIAFGWGVAIWARHADETLSLASPLGVLQIFRHCEERQRRSNPGGARRPWVASLRSQ